MRVLIGTDTYPPTVNGAAQFSQRLARGLVKRGHQVHVACPSPMSSADQVVEDDGVVLHRLRSFRYGPYNAFPVGMPGTVGRATRRVLDEVVPDVVHVQDFFLLGRSLIRHARSRKIGVVATNHFMPENVFDHIPWPSMLNDVASRMMWWDLARIYRQAGVITSPTPRAVELLRRSAGLSAIAVSNGIDIAPYDEAAKASDHSGAPVILFVGRLDREKRVDDLLHAMAQVPSDVPGRLEIVGTGSLHAEWKELAQKLGLGTNRVDFRGFLSEEALLSAYGDADLFCMPGIAELQSLATLEAMAAGTAAIAANAMALPHLVHHNENGFLHGPGDVTDLARQLTRLLRNEGLRQTMGARSREIVAEHSMERTVTKFEELYAQVSLDSRETYRNALPGAVG